MEDFIDSMTGGLLRDYQKKMDEFLLYKLMLAKRKAMELNDIELLYILDNLDLTNIEKTQKALTEKGYALELDQPQPEFTSNGNIFKAIIQTDQLKLRIRKLIIEV